MARYTGKCTNCGDDRSPKGNVFTVMRSWEFETDNRYQHPLPADCEDLSFVKVCNNCQYPHPFRPRVSAKAAQREALIQSLLCGA